MYHIFSPQGQTQFAGTEGGEDSGRLGTPFGEADELAPTVRRAVTLAANRASAIRSPLATVRHAATSAISPALATRSPTHRVRAARALALVAALAVRQATASRSVRRSPSAARAPRRAATLAASRTSPSRGRKRRRRVRVPMRAPDSMQRQRAELRVVTRLRAIRALMIVSRVTRRVASTSRVRMAMPVRHAGILAASPALGRRRALGIVRHGRILGTGLRSRVGISQLLRRAPHSCGTRTMTTYRALD